MSSVRQAETKSSTFRTQTTIAAEINASPDKIWRLLTDASYFPRWNSTVTEVQGKIAEGEQLKLRVRASPKRVFKPTVTEFQPLRQMTWAEGAAPMFRGVRTFTLTPTGNGTTKFTMEETLRGLMLPLVKGALPEFGPIFETYASDLKREAERIA